MSRNPFRKSVGFYEVMATSYTTGATSDTAYTKTSQMENYTTDQNSSSSDKRNVGFSKIDQHKETKKKYLTAKYGAHQMLLIKKRLGVEMWIFEELRKLYNRESDDHDCELELEDILNLDSDVEKRQYALKMLQHAKQSQEEVDKFVEELLKRAKTL